MAYRRITSESVTEGHPDKIADQISDAVLDSILIQDPNGRVAVEALVTTGMCIVAGEISTDCYIEIPVIVRRTLERIGYAAEWGSGFDFLSAGVLVAIQPQSPDIDLGVRRGGAGDQGTMYGYACRETPELMPLPIMLAHKLVRRLSEVRKQRLVDFLHPDGKSQVTVRYDEQGQPLAVDHIVVSAHHTAEASLDEVVEAVRAEVIDKVIDPALLSPDATILVNPTGRFVRGGPLADTGVTGRKIIVDTYGGVAHHGGGSFSGKDPTKVDRSATYMARHIAKNLVAAHLADRCEVELSYVIGYPDPVAAEVDTFGTGRLADEALSDLVREVFPLTPGDIIEALDLRRPIYFPLAAYGHFGRDPSEAPWERTDAAAALRDRAGLATAAP